MTEKLVYTINNKKYVLIEYLLTTSINKEKFKRTIKKYGIIEQGIKKLERGGFISDGYAIINLLIPEKNIRECMKVFEEMR